MAGTLWLIPACLAEGGAIGFSGGVVGIGGSVPDGVRLACAMPEARLKLIFACMLPITRGLLLLRGAA